MAKQKRRPANDRAFKKYKTSNQRYKNKIAKLVRHVKEHPEDEVGKENLERVKSKGISDKRPPIVNGSNKTVPKPKPRTRPETAPRTAGEQLSELLGIPMPKPKKRRKPRITKKKRRYVKQS